MIRLATPEDVPQINSLLSDFFAYNAEQQPTNYIPAIENGEYPFAVITGDSGDFIIAESDNMVVGFIHIEENNTPPYPSVAPHTFACIIDFIVKQQYRKKNIGHLLLQEAKVWAQSRNLEYIELMVLENNEIGKSFYNRENFVTMSRTMRLHF